MPQAVDRFAAMPKPRVYVETTIPSFYHETRTQPHLVAWRDLTREWWSDAAERYDLFTSFAVHRELAEGSSSLVPLRLELLDGIPLLAFTPEIDEIVEVYLQHRLMPRKPSTADATHLALASNHACDFIATWNCRHLANPNKATQIRRINSALGLHVPELVTPQDLLRRRR